MFVPKNKIDEISIIKTSQCENQSKVLEACIIRKPSIQIKSATNILNAGTKERSDPTALPSSWHTAKKSVCYKVLTDLLIKTLKSCLESVRVISKEQHGFRKEQCTEIVCKALMAYVKKSLTTPYNPPYTVFVYFKAGFDSAPRGKPMLTLAEMCVAMNVLDLLTAILRNKITIDEGTAEPFYSHRKLN